MRLLGSDRARAQRWRVRLACRSAPLLHGRQPQQLRTTARGLSKCVLDAYPRRPTGVAYDYWEQYLTVEDFLRMTILYASLAAVAVALAFLVTELLSLGWGFAAALQGAAAGAVFIASTISASVVTVVGLLGWAGVPLSGLTAMSSLMAVGYATEFAVHITHHFIANGASTARERVDAAMSSVRAT